MEDTFLYLPSISYFINHLQATVPLRNSMPGTGVGLFSINYMTIYIDSLTVKNRDFGRRSLCIVPNLTQPTVPPAY